MSRTDLILYANLCLIYQRQTAAFDVCRHSSASVGRLENTLRRNFINCLFPHKMQTVLIVLVIVFVNNWFVFWMSFHSCRFHDSRQQSIQLQLTEVMLLTPGPCLSSTCAREYKRNFAHTWNIKCLLQRVETIMFQA